MRAKVSRKPHSSWVNHLELAVTILFWDGKEKEAPGKVKAFIWQSFASRVHESRDFFSYGKIIPSIRGDLYGASSGFGRLGQNPEGAITFTQNE